MMKDIIIFLLLSILGFALFLNDEILNENSIELTKKISRCNLLINKLRNISKIDKNLNEFKNRERLYILDKDMAQERAIDIFDRYKDIFSFRADKFYIDKNRVVLSIKGEKILENKKQSELFANFFELNSLDGTILIDKNIKYNEGKIDFSLDINIPFREL